jgi:hypothetical protein
MRLDIRRYFRRQQQTQIQPQPKQNLDHKFSNYDINKPAEISDYIQKRFLPIFDWFKSKTRANVRTFKLWRISLIILALFIVIFDVSVLGYYDGRPSSSATAIASSIAAVLMLGSTAFVQLTRTQENLHLFSTASQRLEREYQLFMLKAGVYSPSIPSASDNVAEDDKSKSKLFVENIENIISSHTSESRLQFPAAFNQAPD